MSASPMARQATGSKAIPIKKVLITDPSELPSHYSSTPGGTLFSTTPGGTKIVYERTFLMNLRESPISKTPPTYDIPDALLREHDNPKNGYIKKSVGVNSQPRKGLPPKGRASGSKHHKSNDVQEDQFQLEL